MNDQNFYEQTYQIECKQEMKCLFLFNLFKIIRINQYPNIHNNEHVFPVKSKSKSSLLTYAALLLYSLRFIHVLFLVLIFPCSIKMLKIDMCTVYEMLRDAKSTAWGDLR